MNTIDDPAAHSADIALKRTVIVVKEVMFWGGEIHVYGDVGGHCCGCFEDTVVRFRQQQKNIAGLYEVRACHAWSGGWTTHAVHGISKKKTNKQHDAIQHNTIVIQNEHTKCTFMHVCSCCLRVHVCRDETTS